MGPLTQVLDLGICLLVGQGSVFGGAFVILRVGGALVYVWKVYFKSFEGAKAHLNYRGPDFECFGLKCTLQLWRA